MKIVAVNGSPRKNWNTDILLHKALEGARSAGAETELVQLYDLDYKGCRSCMACNLAGGGSYGRCAYNDGLKPVLDRIDGSDGSLALTIKASAAGVKAGDTVKVTVDGVVFTMPVAADAASAVKGQNALIISGDTLTVSLVGGDFATANKIAAKTVAENGAVQWYYTEATAVPAVVSISK